MVDSLHHGPVMWTFGAAFVSRNKRRSNDGMKSYERVSNKKNMLLMNITICLG